MNYKEILEKIKTEGNYKVFSGGFSSAMNIKYSGCGLRENNTGNPQIFWMKNGSFHKLDGPAIIDAISGIEYYITNRFLNEQQFWQHPLVINHKLNKIINL